jgi:hypothetical protein
MSNFWTVFGQSGECSRSYVELRALFRACPLALLGRLRSEPELLIAASEPELLIAQVRLWSNPAGYTAKLLGALKAAPRERPPFQAAGLPQDRDDVSSSGSVGPKVTNTFALYSIRRSARQSFAG